MNHFLKPGMLAFGAIAGVMVVTNPSKESYVDYFVTKMPDQVCALSSTGNSNHSNWTGATATELCKGAIGIGSYVLRDKIEGFVKQETKPQNLVLFSFYTTRLPGKTIKTVGVFGNFVTVSSK
jgi:hypothetical protein